MTAGIDASGFTPKTLLNIRDEINADLKEDIDPALDLSETEPLGQVVGAFSRQLATAWELLNLAYQSDDPDKVEAAAQDALCLLTGTIREKATKTKVLATLALNASTTVSAGKQVSVTGRPDLVFDLLADVTSVGAGNYTGTFECETTGPIAVNSGTLTNIITPVAGWTGVTNADPGIPGTDIETDTNLRVRRTQELAAQGSSSLDATVEAVKQVAEVIEVIGLENVTLATDANGLPGKSGEIVVWDGPGLDADGDVIGQTIWDNKPTGIQTYGSLVTDVVDSQGGARSVSWSRATQLTLWLDFDISKDATYAGDTAVKDAVIARALEVLKIGKSVTALRLRDVPLGLTGVLDVPAMRLGYSSTPVGLVNLAVGVREIAVVISARITINYV